MDPPIELTGRAAAAVAPLLPARRVPARAVVEGLAPGRVFADDPDRPTAAFVWTELRFCSLVGDPDPRFTSGLARLLDAELLPAAAASDDPVVVLDPGSPAWTERIGLLLPARRWVTARRASYSFDPARFRQAAHAGVGVERVSRETAPAVVGPLVGVSWNSIEGFLEHGLGFRAVEDGVEVGTCLSVCAADGVMEVAVEVDPRHRGRGAGTRLAAAFVGHCAARGIGPVWEAWEHNEASARLAARLGYRPAGARDTAVVDLSRG